MTHPNSKRLTCHNFPRKTQYALDRCILDNYRRAKKSHIGQFVVDLAVQEGALIAGESGLQALLDESAD